MSLKIGIIRDENYLKHNTGVVHPEHPNRLKFLYRMLDSDFSRDLVPIEPTFATLENLELVHTPVYIDKVMRTAGKDFTHLSFDTPASAKTYVAAWLAAGACITGVDALFSGAFDTCVALIRPPGHHARPDRASGFCIFNNIGIAARYAVKTLGLSRILILDWDLHHGNGIQDLFYSENEIMYVSSHFYGIYPYTGTLEEIGIGAGQGYNVNIHLPKKVNDRDIVCIYHEIVGRIMRRYRPQLIIVAAGFDLHMVDFVSSSRVTEIGFGMLTKLLIDLRTTEGNPPILFSLEGGYQIFSLVKSIREVLNTLLTSECTGDIPDGTTDTARNVVGSVKDIHRPYGVWAD